LMAQMTSIMSDLKSQRSSSPPLNLSETALQRRGWVTHSVYEILEISPDLWMEFQSSLFWSIQSIRQKELARSQPSFPPPVQPTPVRPYSPSLFTSSSSSFHSSQPSSLSSQQSDVPSQLFQSTMASQQSPWKVPTQYY
jgi:hypothetical protein